MKQGVEGLAVSHGMKFYRDEDGNPRSESYPPFALVSRYLTEDIQDSLNVCREVLGIIDRIIMGQIGSWRQAGNAHVLNLSVDEARVESLTIPAEGPCRLGLEGFRDILKAWLRFLEEDQSHNTTDPGATVCKRSQKYS